MIHSLADRNLGPTIPEVASTRRSRDLEVFTEPAAAAIARYELPGAALGPPALRDLVTMADASYSIVPVTTPEDYAKLDNFVHTIFLPDMPLIPMFGISPGPSYRLPSPHQPAPDSFTAYLKAVDPRGEMVGIAVCKEHVVFDTDPSAPAEWNQMVDFMNYMEKDSKLDHLPGRTIELLILSVRDDWRNRGIARKLAEECVRTAREAGFTTMTICCSSEFTAKLARRLGWREHYRLAYKDYPRLSGTDICLKPTPPHDHIYIYTKDLS